MQSNNINIPGGEISAGRKNFSIKSTGSIESLEEIEQTIVSSYGGRIVYLKDVADIGLAYEDHLWKASFNGERAIFISMKLKKGYNILEVDKKVQAVADHYRELLPPSITLNTSFEQASAVQDRINDFFLNLLQGIGLILNR